MVLQRTSIPSKYFFYPHYFLCDYLPASAGRDTLSRSLLFFKLGRQPDLDGWIDCTLQSLASFPWQPGTIILRALRHDETTTPAPGTSPTSMDILGQALATRFHCSYLPGLLRKSRPSRPCKGLPRCQRITELQHSYVFTPPAPDPIPSISPDPLTPFNSAAPPPILIIDDILTTGTTIRMIIRAIRQHAPRSPLLIFTLAKAGYDNTLNFSTPLRGQNYELRQGAGWQVSEQETGYAKPTHPYFDRPDLYSDRPYSAEILRFWILANSF